MKIYYYKDPSGNFGDDLNDWIWSEVAPWIEDIKSDFLFIGIGSLLNTAHLKDKKAIVFGTGAGYRTIPAVIDNPDIKISCVRGKLTANVLKIDESLAVADGAILLNTIKGCEPISENEREGVIFVPHHNTIINGDWHKACQLANIELVDPRGDSKEILQKIRGSKLVIAEAMHAAIVADAMRVPWIPVVASHRINTFKWLDFLSTIDIKYKPHYIGHTDHIEELNNKHIIGAGLGMYKPNHAQLDLASLVLGEKHNKLKRFKNKVSKKILDGKLKQLNASKGVKKLSKMNSKRVLTVAANFNKINLEHSYLSEDSIFSQNLNNITSKLDKLKAQYI